MNVDRPYLDEIERGRFIALLRNLENPMILKIVPVPGGQSLEFDEGSATRRWLDSDLGSEWHLVSFHEIGFYTEDQDLVEFMQNEINWLSDRLTKATRT